MQEGADVLIIKDNMFTYYHKVQSKEHYLSAKECAILLYMNDFCTKSDKQLTAFVSAAFSYEQEKAGIEPLYYCTRNGMMRVYSNWSELLKIINDKLSSRLKYPGDTADITIRDKTYTVKRKAGIDG